MSEQIRFTEQCEKAIQAGTLSNILSELQNQLESYTSVDPGSVVLQLKLKALILDLIHSIEVVERLMESKVKSVGAWLWQKQLR